MTMLQQPENLHRQCGTQCGPLLGMGACQPNKPRSPTTQVSCNNMPLHNRHTATDRLECVSSAAGMGTRHVNAPWRRWPGCHMVTRTADPPPGSSTDELEDSMYRPSKNYSSQILPKKYRPPKK